MRACLCERRREEDAPLPLASRQRQHQGVRHDVRHQELDQLLVRAAMERLDDDHAMVMVVLVVLLLCLRGSVAERRVVDVETTRDTRRSASDAGSKRLRDSLDSIRLFFMTRRSGYAFRLQQRQRQRQQQLQRQQTTTTTTTKAVQPQDGISIRAYELRVPVLIIVLCRGLRLGGGAALLCRALVLIVGVDLLEDEAAKEDHRHERDPKTEQHVPVPTGAALVQAPVQRDEAKDRAEVASDKVYLQ